MNERRQSSSSSSASSSSSSSSCCGGGGIVDSTYVTYVSPSLSLLLLVVCVSSCSLLLLTCACMCVTLSFVSLLVVFISSFRGKIFTSSSSSAASRGSLSPRFECRFEQTHSRAHSHGQTHTHVHNMLVSENYFAFFLMLLKLVIHSSFAASFVNKQNYSQLTSEMHFFFFFFCFFFFLFELKLILGGQFFVSSLLYFSGLPPRQRERGRFGSPVRFFPLDDLTPGIDGESA